MIGAGEGPEGGLRAAVLRGGGHLVLRQLLGVGMAMGPGIGSVVAAIVATQWIGTFRSVRSEAQRIRSADFLRAAEAMGASASDRIVHHVVPNLVPLLSTAFALQLVFAVQAEAVLGYLGLSAQDLPSWGRMLLDAQTTMFLSPGQAIFPGLAIALAVLGLNLLGDGLRDALDPRSIRIHHEDSKTQRTVV